MSACWPAAYGNHGKATRPGDIIRSYAGKTVEIGNTDAEGRLILIDAMAYANKKYKPNTMVDLATLTGACVIALGGHLTGLMSPDDQLAADLLAAGPHMLPAVAPGSNPASTFGLPWLVHRLRQPDGCPWDREQSMDDIITYLIEESYELLQAERSGDWDEVVTR